MLVGSHRSRIGLRKLLNPPTSPYKRCLLLLLSWRNRKISRPINLALNVCSGLLSGMQSFGRNAFGKQRNLKLLKNRFTAMITSVFSNIFRPSASQTCSSPGPNYMPIDQRPVSFRQLALRSNRIPRKVCSRQAIEWPLRIAPMLALQMSQCCFNFCLLMVELWTGLTIH